MTEHGTARRTLGGRSATRRRLALSGLFAAGAAIAGLTALDACSSNSAANFSSDSSEAGPDAAYSFDAGTGNDSPSTVVTNDSGFVPIDAAPPPACPGTSLPAASTGACVLDNSESCPSCAPWGFACAGGAGQTLQVGSASSSCLGSPAEDGGLLVCCTQPTCVVSTSAGPCDASTQTRYECNGGAVPTGACGWLGSATPNDYCCQ
jgi:hypothetical protein